MPYSNISLSVYFTHTQSYRTLSPLLNTGGSKCVFIYTQSYHTLSSPPNTGRSKCISVYIQSYQSLSPLPNTGGSNVYLPTHKAIKHYPLYRTLVGQSVFFIHTQSYQFLSSLPRMVVLTVRKHSLYLTNNVKV